jgi:hypothetical protein
MRCRSEPVTPRNDCPWPAEREPHPSLPQRRHGHVRISTVERVLMEQPRPFDVGVAEVAFACQ